MATKPDNEAHAKQFADIRAAAARLAEIAREVTVRAKLLEQELYVAVAPIHERHRAGLDALAELKARAEEDLMLLVVAAPDLFQKPRSITVDGVRAGYRKEEDFLDWDDPQVIIARIESLLAEQVDLLVRTEKSLVLDAVVQLDAGVLQRIGVRRVPGIDRPFVTIGDSDLDRLVKTILADAAKRVGDEEATKKKGKAKIKAAA